MDSQQPKPRIVPFVHHHNGAEMIDPANPFKLSAKQANERSSIPFDTISPNDFYWIKQIAERGVAFARTHAGVYMDVMQVMMDICNAHCTTHPMMVERWMMAGDADFLRDFTEITNPNNINRREGGLFNYTPIFAKKKN